ncbi:MAG TPA: cbb3-type cytochrome c oxidase N-terminal domain-containing protein [Ignavibacteriales bacterium]|nr:cbb3-type cytochrome c oxidase N-terminal domain-containing protein [Ignavibacteriales bacterium]
MVRIKRDIKFKEKFKPSALLALGTVLLSCSNVFSQDTTAQAAPSGEMNWGSYAKWASVLLGISVIFILWLTLTYGNRPEIRGEKKKFSFLKIVSKISAAAPLEKEQEIIMEDNFDGIRELNNKIPPWFNILFIGTIIFSAIYLLDYHVFGSGQVSKEEYQQEMEDAALQKEILNRTGKLVSEATVTELKDPGSIQAGKETFLAKCAVCHGRQAEGVVGPNLTDDYWIHGTGIKNVFRVIKDGVPQKGMPTWDGQISPKQIQEVASYVLSLHGTNPPNSKAPQGVKAEEDSTNAAEAKKLNE